MDGVTLVMYQGEIVAIVGSRRFYLAPQLDDLQLDDPLVVFVSFMASYALQVKDGSAPGPFTDERAERFARLVLMDDDEFRALDANRLEDDLIAGHFSVPVEQVAAKRDDLDQ
jgi:hypothetical protein